VAIEAEDIVACLAYVALSTAIAVVPESATKVGPDDVEFIPLGDAPLAPLYCVHLRDNSALPLRLFIDYLDARAQSVQRRATT
jgi:DNA-binding transcriptional LysR family regulator